jgi:hypothetical protein
MKISQLFPSKYLKLSDLEGGGAGPWRVTITDVVQEKTERGDELLVVFFAELEKGLVLKKTNAVAIEALYGDDTSDWIGQQVDLVGRQQDFKGRTYDVIRILPPKSPKAKVKVPDA